MRPRSTISPTSTVVTRLSQRSWSLIVASASPTTESTTKQKNDISVVALEVPAKTHFGFTALLFVGFSEVTIQMTVSMNVVWFPIHPKICLAYL